MSLSSFSALEETGSTNTKAHMCFHLKKMCPRFPYTYTFCLPLKNHSPSFAYLSLFSLSSLRSPHALSLSLSPSLHLLLRPPLPPFYLILSSPLHYSSFSFPQEEPQSYLGYVGFGELKSHFTNSLPASPESSAGYLKQFHHSPGFVCWNAAHRATFDSLSPHNANPLPDSPSSGPPSLSVAPSLPSLWLSLCFFSVLPLTKMLDIHILGFFGDVKEC